MKSASSPAHGLTEGKEYSLKLGSSFQNGSRAQQSYHVWRYDFKPASIDTSQPAEVKFSSNKECFVTYPNHDQGSITFKGGRKPCQKECILIIDKSTGEITLEKISSNIPLKKSRTGNSERTGDIRKSGNALPLNPKQKTNVKQHGNKAVNDTLSSSQPSNSSSSQNNDNSQSSQLSHQYKSNINKQPAHKQAPDSKPKDSGSSSSDSSSDSDSSDSDSDLEEHAKKLDSVCMEANKANEQQSSIPPSNKGSNILQDLQLSDSNSDSDSD